MDLTISPANSYSRASNVSFGMAQFSREGLHRAKEMGDVYEPLKSPNDYCPEEFFQKTSRFRKPPFYKYVKQELPLDGKPADRDKTIEVAAMITDCGVSARSESNAKFIKQLVTTKDHIDKLPKETQAPIRTSVAEVLANNWDNPAITDGETRLLAEMAVGGTIKTSGGSDEEVQLEQIGITRKQEMALNGALDMANTVRRPQPAKK